MAMRGGPPFRNKPSCPAHGSLLFSPRSSSRRAFFNESFSSSSTNCLGEPFRSRARLVEPPEPAFQEIHEWLPPSVDDIVIIGLVAKLLAPPSGLQGRPRRTHVSRRNGRRRILLSSSCILGSRATSPPLSRSVHGDILVAHRLQDSNSKAHLANSTIHRRPNLQ